MFEFNFLHCRWGALNLKRRTTMECILYVMYPLDSALLRLCSLAHLTTHFHTHNIQLLCLFNLEPWPWGHVLLQLVPFESMFIRSCPAGRSLLSPFCTFFFSLCQVKLWRLSGPDRHIFPLSYPPTPHTHTPPPPLIVRMLLVLSKTCSCFQPLDRQPPARPDVALSGPAVTVRPLALTQTGAPWEL